MLDHLPASSWTFDVLAPSFWDTPAYVQNLAACVAGIPSDSDLCKAVREIKQVLARMERGRFCKKAPHHALGFGHSKIPIQSIAYSCFVKHLYPDNIYHLVKRRLTTLGVLELGSQLFNADVWTQTVQFYKTSDPYCTICWLKTLCNGWCTSFRMHEPILLRCVFGCQGERDSLQHYFSCMNLWSIVAEVFQFSMPPTLLSRINICKPTSPLSAVMVALFNIYHTVKVGHRPLVDLAIAHRRFGQIHELSYEVASMFKRRYLPSQTQFHVSDDIAPVFFPPVPLSEDPNLVEIAPGVFVHRDSSIYRDLNETQIPLSPSFPRGTPDRRSSSSVAVVMEVA